MLIFIEKLKTGAQAARLHRRASGEVAFEMKSSLFYANSFSRYRAHAGWQPALPVNQ